MARIDPPDRIVVAAAQYPIERLADIDAVKSKHARWVADATERGADLLVFPEYGLMELAGICRDEIAGDLKASLDEVARLRTETDDHLRDLATKHAMHILGPSGPKRTASGQVVNAACFATPNGRSALVEKIIMTPFEVNWGVTGGGTPTVLDTRLGRIAVLICYDSEFPLLARAQAQAGARMLLVPSCTERISGYHRVRTGALARALENTIAAVQSPTVGDAPWSPAVDRNSGSAGIYVPAEAGVSDTGVLAEGTIDAPALVVGEIDFGRLATAKAQGEMRNATDWMHQPGASHPLPPARVVDLR